MANLLVAMAVFLRFASDAGAITRVAGEEILGRAEAAFRSIAIRQSQDPHRPSPGGAVHRGPSPTLITQGKVRFLDPFENAAPPTRR